MPPTRRTFLTVGATMTLAGCLGGNGGSDRTTTTATTTDISTTTTESTATTATTDGTMSKATVQVASHLELGDILVGPKQMTLYMFNSDTKGKKESTCYDSCVDAWPPLTVKGSPTKGDGVIAPLETFERKSGEKQVMAGGWPLYHFASDERPGDVNGQGVNDVWWVLTPDGSPMKSKATATTTTSSDGGGGY
ncbi:COG4315 family predicted lipoprotein [Haladaptatus sp. NG-SE-30]